MANVCSRIIFKIHDGIGTSLTRISVWKFNGHLWRVYSIPTNNVNVVRNRILYQCKLSLLIRVRKNHTKVQNRERDT